MTLWREDGYCYIFNAQSPPKRSSGTVGAGLEQDALNEARKKQSRSVAQSTFGLSQGERLGGGDGHSGDVVNGNTKRKCVLENM